MDNQSKTMNFALIKPFLKWAGGKGNIMDQVIAKFPPDINDYYEPFIGGGSVFLRLLCDVLQDKIKVNGKIVLNDKNSVLISLYTYIQGDIDTLIQKLEELKKHYTNAKMIPQEKRHKHIVDANDDIQTVIPKGKSYVYNHYRNVYNTTYDTLTKCALLLFLNKTCWRGLYREGPNGFNVPFGNYKTPKIYDEAHLRELHKLFNQCPVEFHNSDFTEVCETVSKGDFIYMDPPYHPLKNGKNFVSYNNDGFKDQHTVLIKLCQTLSEKGIGFLQSNSDCDFNRQKYKQFQIERIATRNRINSRKPGNMKFELFIQNKI